MYNPSRYQINDHGLSLEIVRKYNFATLVVQNGTNLEVSHLPLLFTPTGENAGVLKGHMASANPLWKLFSPHTKVTVIFQGPHAYISPRWYTPHPSNVPTWNYCVVHMTGFAKVIDDPNMAFQEMEKLVQYHDPSWPFNLPADDKSGLMSGIKVFEISVFEINGKFKLSQNQETFNRNSVIENLTKSTDQTERDTGALMLKTK